MARAVTPVEQRRWGRGRARGARRRPWEKVDLAQVPALAPPPVMKSGSSWSLTMDASPETVGGWAGQHDAQDRVAGIGVVAGLEAVHAGWARPAGGARHPMAWELVTLRPCNLVSKPQSARPDLTDLI